MVPVVEGSLVVSVVPAVAVGEAVSLVRLEDPVVSDFVVLMTVLEVSVSAVKLDSVVPGEVVSETVVEVSSGAE